MSNHGHDNPGILLPPPLTYLLALVAGLVLDKRFHVQFSTRGIARLVGWPLVVGGVVLNGWFYTTMRRADTPIDPRQPVSKLTTEGPFRYTRNPAYLSMTMVYAGVALLRSSLWALLLLPLVLFVIQRDQIEREERYLEHTFDEEYLEYTARVRRWL
jgi:protein-S-isoprenylcysteine O-methyltransferase Ste14